MKKTVYVCLLVLCVFSMAVPAFANSAPMPGNVIIASGVPKDAVLTVEIPGQAPLVVTRVDEPFESYFYFHNPYELALLRSAVLRITVGEDSFTIPMPDVEYTSYRNVFTLDYRDRSIRYGQEPWREPLLVSLRIILTLLVEGAIFYFSGFRRKRSWAAFIFVNLLTQGGLNYVLTGSFSKGFLLYFVLVALEVVIILFEALALPLLITEQEYKRVQAFTVQANVASLVLGLVLLSLLPV